MPISIITAMDADGLIGKANSLPWYIPIDLKYFKKTTFNHKVVMGRKTFESIGKPLPNRTNILLTKDRDKTKEYQQKGCYVIHSINEFFNKWNYTNEEIFVIGGASIYELFLPYADYLYITKINYKFEGDVYFPEYNKEEFELIYSQKVFNKFDVVFNKYKRK